MAAEDPNTCGGSGVAYRDEFCGKLMGFATTVHAAVIAFAAAIGYGYFVDEYQPVSPASDYLPRILFCLASVTYVIDDWFGSRQLIARVTKEVDLGRRLALPRFAVDLFIAIVAYFIMMSAVRGSRATGVFLAVSLLLGAAWACLCMWKEERPYQPEIGPIDQLMGVAFTHVIGAAAIIAYFVYRYGTSAEAWFGKVVHPWTASILMFGVLVLYRFGVPWVWRVVLGRKSPKEG